ncbi:MAG TPA: TetR family transcriptional regulator [Herpetosiphonaceae bacterium]
MAGRRRAVRDEQKQERRQALLDVAWQLFQATSYQALTINEIADRTGLAKGTVYLYFKTKEELFLSLQEQQFEAWFGEVDARLRALDSSQQDHGAIQQIVAILAETLAHRPGFTRLLAIMHSILEQNIDFATAARFKAMLLLHVSQTGALLEAHLHFLQPGQGAQVLLRIHALTIGLQHLADPAPIVRRVLDEREMQIFAIDFAHEFSATVYALLYGLRSLATRS